MRRLVAVVGFASLALLAGCSQVSALAPVGGDALRMVSIATGDLLESKGIEVMVVPVCTQTAKAATCAGTTMDGLDITVTADLNSPITMIVTVGDAQVYSGQAQEIIDKAARQ